MASLTECKACGRHVRRTEQTCPFCAAGMSSTVESVLPPLPADRRLTRAAFVFASAAAVAACGKTDQQAQPPPQPTLQAPAYGPAVIDPSQLDSGRPQPEAVPAYGAPPVSSQKK